MNRWNFSAPIGALLALTISGVASAQGYYYAPQSYYVQPVYVAPFPQVVPVVAYRPVYAAPVVYTTPITVQPPVVIEPAPVYVPAPAPVYTAAPVVREHYHHGLFGRKYRLDIDYPGPVDYHYRARRGWFSRSVTEGWR